MATSVAFGIGAGVSKAYDIPQPTALLFGGWAAASGISWTLREAVVLAGANWLITGAAAFVATEVGFVGVSALDAALVCGGG